MDTLQIQKRTTYTNNKKGTDIKIKLILNGMIVYLYKNTNCTKSIEEFKKHITENNYSILSEFNILDLYNTKK